jgi:heavy-metal-associated domain-containing protein
MSWVQIAHHIPERTRLRSDVLRRDDTRCTHVADTLAALRGVREVAARPYTGSVLVHHTRELTAQQIVEAAAHALGATILPPGAPPPLPKEAPPFSSVARKLVHAFGEIDRDVRIRTAGAADLGTIATFAFFAAGAAEIIAKGELPLPPWFNLAWWGYRTFMTTEKEEIEVEKIEGELGKLESEVGKLEAMIARRDRDTH